MAKKNILTWIAIAALIYSAQAINQKFLGQKCERRLAELESREDRLVNRLNLIQLDPESSNLEYPDALGEDDLQRLSEEKLKGSGLEEIQELVRGGADLGEAL